MGDDAEKDSGKRKQNTNDKGEWDLVDSNNNNIVVQLSLINSIRYRSSKTEKIKW